MTVFTFTPPLPSPQVPMPHHGRFAYLRWGAQCALAGSVTLGAFAPHAWHAWANTLGAVAGLVWYVAQGHRWFDQVKRRRA